MKPRGNGRIVALEISHDQLHAAVCEPAPDSPPVVRMLSTPWRKDALSLAAPEAAAELAAGLKSLVGGLRIQGSSAQLVLNGDYCVTRVVTGTADQVRQELQQLEQRALQYLALGPGEKTLAASLRPVDAKRQHALLTVVNQNVVNTLMDATAKAGLQVDWIEPALVALGRAVAKAGGDVDDPAIVVTLNERGTELGITHNGSLLLDFRAVGVTSPEKVADLLARHVGRFQRYCDRHIRYQNGRLKRIFLRGRPAEAHRLLELLQKLVPLPAAVLDPVLIEPTWQYRDVGGPEWAGALGACLRPTLSEDEQFGPNLLERIKANIRQPLPVALARTCWPLAATLLFAACCGGVALFQQTKQRLLSGEFAQVEADQREADRLRQQIIRQNTKIEHLTAIRAKLNSPAWDKLVQSLAQCLPNDAWLDSVRIANDDIVLDGAAYSEDGVFEFVKWLQQCPAVEQVSLSGTRPTQMAAGPATTFSIQCRVPERT